MGGCRCTYKNCTSKSDGKTHLFHYPVFEKVRCHQWLVNAHRLDFLDLKVSQLRNRVVCQHHFTSESFMNYMHDKLTFEAVPTEDGPFCDPSKFNQIEEPKEYADLILLEDIENDVIVDDKKANYSIKYSDFLTNNEFLDSSARYNSKNIDLKKYCSNLNLNSSLPIDYDRTILEPRQLQSPPKKINKIKSQPMLIVPPYSDLSNEPKIGKELNVEPDIINLTQSNLKFENQNTISDNFNVVPSLNVNNSSMLNESQIKKEPKVRILSEKKIKTPITITGKFKKISPSITLSLPDKSHRVPKVENDPIIQSIVPIKPDVEPSDQLITQNTLMLEPDINPSAKLKFIEVLDVQVDTAQSKPNVNPVSNEQNVINTDKVRKVSHSPTKKITLLKNKVTPERTAAIEKKRKFNMKLKDVIESCLDKFDPVNNSKSDPSSQTNSQNSNCMDKHNNLPSIITPSEDLTEKQLEVQENCVSKVKTLPTVQEYTIAYLESRMKKMENTLLSKIEQNSQRIMDLKGANEGVQICKNLRTRKSASTQTNVNEHCHKKYLYQEISKYLSPTSNIIIFEELFLNKFSSSEIRSPVKRKRKK